jgi:hypothetical protein
MRCHPGPVKFKTGFKNTTTTTTTAAAAAGTTSNSSIQTWESKAICT